MPRKRLDWKLADRTITLGDRTLIMGVLNVTPDSFSDGGKYADPDRAFARAIELEEQGADIIDIGAESTRPGSTRISEAEELRRLVPVLKRLQGKLQIPISVDTYKSGVAAKALSLGASIINDPSALTFDPQIAKTVANANGALILNHMRGTPETWAKMPPMKHVMSTILNDLGAAVHRAGIAGMNKLSICVDPGLGFGKRKEQNAEILAQLAKLGSLDLPVLAGPSRKHFVARETPEETEFATAAAVTAAILNGTHMVRVHDVVAMRSVVMVADEILLAAAELEAAPAGTSRPGASTADKAGGGYSPVRRSTYQRPAAAPPPPADDSPRRQPIRMTLRKPPAALPAAAPDAPSADAAAPSRSEPIRKTPPRDDRRPFGPPRGRPPQGDSDRGERKPYGPPRGKPSSGDDRRPYGPPRGRPPQGDDARPERRPYSGPAGRGPKEGGPPRGRPPQGGPRDDRRPYGPPRGRPPQGDSDRGDRRPYGPPRGRPPQGESGPGERRPYGPPRGRPSEGGPPRGKPFQGGRPDGGKRSGPPR
ncbi:MAG: dihydropteroate synthase, partial [Bryobacteraceae bacterium]